MIVTVGRFSKVIYLASNVLLLVTTLLTNKYVICSFIVAKISVGLKLFFVVPFLAYIK